MIYAGTSGWAYPSWKPGFYPAKLASAKFLNHYATRLNTVEVNYTFRRFPTEKLLRGWIEATPANFQFAIKAHQKITHIARLRDVADFTSDFIRSLQPLDAEKKLGPVVFELRHASWFSEEVYTSLRTANAALCNAESEKLETPDVQTADFAYLRLRKEEYSAQERKALEQRITRLGGNGDVYIYSKHEDTPEGALHAENVLSAVKG